MRRLTLRVLALALAISVLFVAVWAAQDKEEVEATWTVEGCWIDLTVVPPAVDLGSSINGEDLERLSANDVAVESNCKWIVEIREDDGKIIYKGDYPDPNKPVSDFKWRMNGTAEYKDLSASDQQVTEGGPGSYKFSMDYMVDIRLTDPPGKYAAQLIYTGTTP